MTHAYLPHAHQHLAFKTEEELDGYAPRPFSLLSIDRPPASQRVLSRNGRGTRTHDDGRYIQGSVRIALENISNTLHTSCRGTCLRASPVLSSSLGNKFQKQDTGLMYAVNCYYFRGLFSH